jgi:hypothetical protein
MTLSSRFTSLNASSRSATNRLRSNSSTNTATAKGQSHTHTHTHTRSLACVTARDGASDDGRLHTHTLPSCAAHESLLCFRLVP